MESIFHFLKLFFQFWCWVVIFNISLSEIINLTLEIFLTNRTSIDGLATDNPRDRFIISMAESLWGWLLWTNWWNDIEFELWHNSDIFFFFISSYISLEIITLISNLSFIKDILMAIFFLHSPFTEIQWHISIVVDTSKSCIYNIWCASEIEEKNSILVFYFKITFECNNCLELFIMSLYLRSLYLRISKIYAFVIPDWIDTYLLELLIYTQIFKYYIKLKYIIEIN